MSKINRVLFISLLLILTSTSLQAASIINHGSRQSNKIALTFDACPTLVPAHIDEGILKTLLDTKTPATIFISGRWGKKVPETIQDLSKNNQFELANHSYSHPHMTKISPEDVKSEILKTQNLLLNLTGKKPVLFRAPFGEYDQKLLDEVSGLGLKTIQFDVISGDPSPAFNKDKLIKSVVSQVKNGSIIVMHINGRGWHTAEALPEIIQELKQKGFEFVTISQLLGNNP